MAILKFIIMIMLILLGGFIGEIIGRMFTGDKSVGRENNDTTKVFQYIGMGLMTIIAYGLLFGK